MPRLKDIFWSHAIERDEGKLTCKFCSVYIPEELHDLTFKYHLAGIHGNDVVACHNVPENIKQMAIKACRVIEDRPMKKGRMQNESGSQLSVGSSCSVGNFFCGTSSEGGTGQGQKQTISGTMKKAEKDFVDKLLLKVIVLNNLPFNLLRSVDFKNFVASATNFGPGYILPSIETTRTKLLDEAKKDVLLYVDEMKKTWTQYGCTIMSGIWKDTIRSRCYINLFVSSPTGTIFWKASHVEKGLKNAEFIVDFLSSTIEEIGAINVLQIVTDNGSNYRKAKYILEEKYPNIFATSCAAHCIDLMLEDIDSLEDVANIMCKARQVVKFIYNKKQALDIMRTYTKGKELKRPGVTRFASQFICLDSILKQEEGLRFMVASNEWRHVEDTEKNDAKELTSFFQNEDFWRKGKEIIKFVEPLVRVLKMVDEEGATMGYLYEALDRAKEAIKNASNGRREKYMPYWNIIDKRWNRNLHSPIHAAAAYLNPHLFWNKIVRIDEKVLEGLDLVTKKLLNEDYANMALELVKYHNRNPALFCDGLAMTAIDTYHPRIWWEIFGSSVPTLQKAAIKILSQPCSASACERNWSAFEAANMKKRSNLLPSKLTDLVFIRMNMHLQSMAAEIKKINANPIYIDHVNPFPEAENVEVGLSSDLEEEDDEECRPSRTNEEDDSISWDED